MAEVIWTDPALLDLKDVAEYIAFENLVAAKQLVQSLFNNAARLPVITFISLT